MVTDARLQELVKEGGVNNLRDKVVGVYEKAGFPKYVLANDGYPATTDIDYRLLVGYGANSDRYEDWRDQSVATSGFSAAFHKISALIGLSSRS
jgi:alkaline phosphatase